MQTEAWRWQAPGAPEQLQRAALELPPLGDLEVLIENRIVAFNPVDWKLIASGHPAWQPGQVPGVDGMGSSLLSAVAFITGVSAVAWLITPTCAGMAVLHGTPRCRLGRY